MHNATVEEIEAAETIAAELAIELDRLMDARVGAGNWSKPDDAENAVLHAEMSLSGWASVARDGNAVRGTLDYLLKETRRRINEWGYRMPDAIRTGPNAEVSRAGTASA